MTMIEQVARAQFDAWRNHMVEQGEKERDLPANFEALGTSERAFAMLGARAAIEALREPHALAMAGFYGDRHDLASEQDMDEHWKSAIDAILAEEPK